MRMIQRVFDQLLSHIEAGDFLGAEIELRTDPGKAAVGNLAAFTRLTGRDSYESHPHFAVPFILAVRLGHEHIALRVIRATRSRPAALAMVRAALAADEYLLHHAARRKQVTLLKALVVAASQQDLRHLGECGYTAAHFAAAANSPECLKVLVDADPQLAANVLSSHDQSRPLEQAAMTMAAGSIQFLLPLSPRPSRVKSMLILAGKNAPDAMKVLLAAADAAKAGHAAELAAECIILLPAAAAQAAQYNQVLDHTEVILLLVEAVLRQRDLTAAEWASLPEQLPGVQRLLPLVLPDRTAQAGLLVRHMLPADSARLRAGMLALARCRRPAPQQWWQRLWRRRAPALSLPDLPYELITAIMMHAV